MNSYRNYFVGFILIISFLFTPAKIFSQQDTYPKKNLNNSLSLTAGIIGFHILDRKISPVRYANNIYSMNLCYNYTTPRTKNIIEISGSTGNLHSDIIDRPVKQYGLDIYYRLGFKALEFSLFGISNETYIGPELRCSYYYTKIAYDEGVMLDWEYTYILNRSMGMSISCLISLNRRNSLEFGISMPVLSLVSRPGYSMISLKDEEMPKDVAGFFYLGKGEYVWENFNMFADVDYLFKITGNIGAKIYYKFCSLNESRPKQLNLFTNYIGAGAVWNF